MDMQSIEYARPFFNAINVPMGSEGDLINTGNAHESGSISYQKKNPSYLTSPWKPKADRAKVDNHKSIFKYLRLLPKEDGLAKKINYDVLGNNFLHNLLKCEFNRPLEGALSTNQKSEEPVKKDTPIPKRINLDPSMNKEEKRISDCARTQIGAADKLARLMLHSK